MAMTPLSDMVPNFSFLKTATVLLPLPSQNGCTPRLSDARREDRAMIRRAITASVVFAAFVPVMVLAAGPASASSPVQLLLPQGTAFSILGYDCGGIREQVYANGFDPATGYPTGDAYLSTTCSAGGKGGHSFTVTAWTADEWDFTGTVVSYSKLTSAPTVDPAFSAYDSHGNEVYNTSPASGYDQAYLVLAAGFIPSPRVASVSPSSAPQGTSVTITGTGFTGATGVAFGAKAAVSFAVTSDTSMTAVAPAGRTGTVNVTVIGPGGTSEINSSDGFTFTLTPRVAGLTPNHGSADGGTKVTLTGVNFKGATAVSFGGIPAHFKVVSGTAITAVSPYVSDPIVVYVTVTSAYGTSVPVSADQFTYSN